MWRQEENCEEMNWNWQGFEVRMDRIYDNEIEGKILGELDSEGSVCKKILRMIRNEF